MAASNFPGLTFAKGQHGSLAIDQARRVRRSKDERESDKVRQRSGGLCEVWEVTQTVLAIEGNARLIESALNRCLHRAAHVHHMIGGRMRGRGASALADHKQHVCEAHHRDINGTIGGKTLQRVGGPMPWWTDVYRRVR